MKKAAFIIGIAVVLGGCHPKQTAVERFEDFAKEIREESSGWSEMEWDEAAQKYEMLKEELLVYPLTPEEMMHLDSLHLECLMAFFGRE